MRRARRERHRLRPAAPARRAPASQGTPRPAPRVRPAGVRAQGYHAAAMDDIAERAGVSKPVLYQHFPGKLDLYLALLDTSCDAIIDNCRPALASTHDNKQRVEAAIAVFFDLRRQRLRRVPAGLRVRPDQRAVRARARRPGHQRVRRLIARVIRDDTGLPRPPACSRSPCGNGAGQRAVLAVREGPHPATEAAALVGTRLGRHPRLPPQRRALTRHQTSREGAHVEVKIGIQHASRELNFEPTEDLDSVEQKVAEAVKDGISPSPTPGAADRGAGRPHRVRRDRWRGRRPGRLPQLSAPPRLHSSGCFPACSR